MFNLDKAIRIAKYSEIIYKGYSDMCDILLGEEWQYFERQDTQAMGVIDRDNKDVYVIFRGTSSLEDLITDAKCTKVDTDFGGVHKGVFEAYQAVAKDTEGFVLKIIREHKDYKIWAGGHSLGAMSILLADRIVRHAGIGYISGVYTFGGMRIFDREGGDAYNQLLGDITYSVVYVSDHVPNFPYGYCRVGQRVYINTKNKIDDTGKEWNKEYFARIFDTLKNSLSFNAFKKPHSIENYCKKLIQGKKNE